MINVSPYEFEQRPKDDVESFDRWFVPREPFSWPDWCERLRDDHDSSGDSVPTWWMAL